MKRYLPILGAVAIGLCRVSLAIAQTAATTVQLPTYQVFSVDTSVSVPDGGSAFLGGVSRSYQSSLQRGLPGAGHLPGVNRFLGSRGFASGMQTGTTRIHAQIIDLQEMDRAVLAEATRLRRLRGPTAGPPHRCVRPASRDPLAARVAEVHRQQLGSWQPGWDPIAIRFRDAAEAVSQGKPELAAEHYRFIMAYGKSTERREASTQLANLSRTTPRD